MRKILLSFLLIVFFQSAFGVKYISGRIIDKNTGELLPYVTVELLTKDSSIVDMCNSRIDKQGTFTGSYTLKYSDNGEYILRYKLLGYNTVCKKITINMPKRSSEYGVSDIFMEESPHMLKGISISGTKIKMVNRGDTIVYNADAFRLAEGSMLDALVSQLPGTELKDDGKLYVNGKFVQNLIVNGRDFFRGDPSVALKNLPAYTVDKIKVYDKAGDLSTLMRKKIKEDMEYVMDIRLKKEYSTGWLSNVDAAIGTNDRNLAKLFGLGFTKLSRFSAFCNMNNVNDRRRPGANGDWQPSDVSDGLMASKTMGVTYSVEDKKRKFKFDTNGTINHDDTDNKKWSSVQNYLVGGDTYSKSINTIIAVR